MQEVPQLRCLRASAIEWTGTTYQEKQAQGNEGAIFGFAAVLVFLFLAAPVRELVDSSGCAVCVTAWASSARCSASGCGPTRMTSTRKSASSR